MVLLKRFRGAATAVVLPGAGSLTLEAFCRRLGQRFERTLGISAGAAGHGLGSATQQSLGTEVVPVLREREIAHLPFGGRPAVAHVNARELGITTKPLLVDLHREAA